MADNRIQDASWDIVNSTRDANQALANTTVTVLDLNAKFAQTTFLSTIEVLERETDDLRDLAQEWGRQIQRQQEAFQRLVSASLRIYMNFLLAPLSPSRPVVKASQQMVETSQQGVETVATTMRHVLEQAREEVNSTFPEVF